MAIVLGTLAILFIIPYDKTSWHCEYGVCSSLFVFSWSGAASGYNQILSPIYLEENEASYLSFADYHHCNHNFVWCFTLFIL